MCDAAKTVLSVECIVLNSHTRKERGFQNSNLKASLKK